MLPRILPHRLLVKKIHRNIIVSGSETAAGCCEVGARIPGILQFIQVVINLLSHLGMGKQQILQPGLRLLQLPWDLPSASLVLGQMLLPLASSSGHKHHRSGRRWDTNMDFRPPWIPTLVHGLPWVHPPSLPHCLSWILWAPVLHTTDSLRGY